MKKPLFVRPFTENERALIIVGLRSSRAFVLRRSQILLASARGERVPSMARILGCDEQTVRNAIHAFNMRGIEALQAGSRRPHHFCTALSKINMTAWRRRCIVLRAILALRRASGRSNWWRWRASSKAG